jgi:hypothetical protein
VDGAADVVGCASVEPVSASVVAVVDPLVTGAAVVSAADAVGLVTSSSPAHPTSAHAVTAAIVHRHRRSIPATGSQRTQSRPERTCTCNGAGTCAQPPPDARRATPPASWISTMFPHGSRVKLCKPVPTSTGSLTRTPCSRSAATVVSTSATSTA